MRERLQFETVRVEHGFGVQHVLHCAAIRGSDCTLARSSSLGCRGFLQFNEIAVGEMSETLEVNIEVKVMSPYST